MRSDPRPMNFAERLLAGPPVLATVGRRAAKGDVVVLGPRSEQYGEREEAFEVTQTNPAIVGTAGLIARSLADPGYFGLFAYSDVTVLTKAEAKAAREHYADLEANP